MAASAPQWKLKCYARFSVSGRMERKSWKVFDTNDNRPEIVVTILEPGYLLVMQGRVGLDTISLLCGSEFLKVHRKYDKLTFQITMKGEGRMTRMQFDGGNRAEAVQKCSSAVEELTKYVPVTTQDDSTPPHNQPPAEVVAPASQTKAAGAEPEVVQGYMSIKRLTEHLLGEAAVALPQVYHQSPLAECDLKPILRVCLLDPSFHALVEKVEVELKKLLEE